MLAEFVSVGITFTDALRILKRYPDAKPEDYIFYPQYQNRTTASSMLQRLFMEVLRHGGIEVDTPTGKAHTLYSLRHTAICMRIINSEGRVNIFNLAKNAENLVLTAISMADEIGMDKEVISVKFADNISKMGEIISNDAINISLLTDKYGEHCKVVVEDPTSRLIYWMNKEQG